MAAARDNQDLVLTQLSGPASLSFLTPSDPSFPLVLLLGDVHRSEANRCDPCAPPTCYPIESLEFLEALDELAEEYPIDFYTESDPELQRPAHPNNAQGRNVLFRRFLRNTVKRCHHTPMRLSANYVANCPTSYIRWHYTDIRTFPHTVEGYLFAPLRYVLEINVSEYQEWEQGRNDQGEFRLESFAYLKTRYPKIVYSVNDAGLYQAGGRFTKEWLESVSELKQGGGADGAIAVVAANHVFHVFHESQAFRNKVMEGSVPVMPLSQLILSHLSASHPHLEPYQEQIFHLVWNLFMGSSPFKPGGFKDKGALHAFVLSIVEMVAAVATFLHRHYESYFAFLRGANAVKTGLWKQYQKQTLPVLQDPARWVTLFCKDGLRFPGYLLPFVSLYFYQTFFEVEPIYPVLRALLVWNKRALLPLPFLDGVLRPAYAGLDLLVEHGKGLVIKMMTALFQAIIYTEKNMVDLYLLLRMFKRPGKGAYQEEGVQGLLAIAFLGNEHSRHLRDLLLLPELGYREKVGVVLPKTNRMSQVSRCIRLPQPLSLRGELEAAAAQMKEWGANRRNRYRRRVAEENQARGKKRVYQTRKRVASAPSAVSNNNNNSMYGYS